MTRRPIGPLHPQLVCPTCSMTAGHDDERHFPYLAATESASSRLRRCRNCGSTICVAEAGIAFAISG